MMKKVLTLVATKMEILWSLDLEQIMSLNIIKIDPQ
jgi:hypothetical protein